MVTCGRLSGRTERQLPGKTESNLSVVSKRPSVFLSKGRVLRTALDWLAWLSGLPTNDLRGALARRSWQTVAGFAPARRAVFPPRYDSFSWGGQRVSAHCNVKASIVGAGAGGPADRINGDVLVSDARIEKVIRFGDGCAKAVGAAPQRSALCDSLVRQVAMQLADCSREIRRVVFREMLFKQRCAAVACTAWAVSTCAGREFKHRRASDCRAASRTIDAVSAF